MFPTFARCKVLENPRIVDASCVLAACIYLAADRDEVSQVLIPSGLRPQWLSAGRGWDEDKTRRKRRRRRRRITKRRRKRRRRRRTTGRGGGEGGGGGGGLRGRD
eukprot:9241358-Pyramimonas_sp.AAC.1